MSKFLLVITVLFSIATFLVLWMTQGDGGMQSGQDIAAISSDDEQDAYSSGAAAIGGSFTLTDQLGRVRTDLDFRGRTMLVFFGFTNCPDICPVTVATLSSLMELLGDKASQVAPVFITVDPKRDTPEVMKAYLKNFDQRIVALTGSARAIKDVTDAYKVFYSEAKGGDAEEDDAQSSYMKHGDMDAGHGHEHHAGHGGHKPSADNYQVDHSGYIYVMDTEGRYVQHFPYNVSEQELADALKPFLK